MPPSPTVSMCALSIKLRPPPLPRSTPTTLGRPGTGSMLSTTRSWSRSHDATKAAMADSPLPRATRSGLTDSIATRSQVSLETSSRIVTPRSSPWSNRWFNLVQMLAPMAGPHRVERAVFIQASKEVIRQRGHELVGLARNPHRQVGQVAWCNRVDKRTRGVVDPIHVLGLVVGRREWLAALELAGEIECPAVPERDVAQHSRDAPVPVDHRTELLIAQTRNQRPHPRELALVCRHEGAIHDDQIKAQHGNVSAMPTITRAIQAPAMRLAHRGGS